LRAVILTDNGRHKLENILDVVDRRTLAAMLKQAGFRPGETFPPNVSGFLQQQTLIRDDDMLNQLKRVLATRGADEKTTDSRGERTATRTGQLSDRRTV
jgi:hypothetical protein